MTGLLSISKTRCNCALSSRIINQTSVYKTKIVHDTKHLNGRAKIGGGGSHEALKERELNSCSENLSYHVNGHTRTPTPEVQLNEVSSPEIR